MSCLINNHLVRDFCHAKMNDNGVVPTVCYNVMLRVAMSVVGFFGRNPVTAVICHCLNPASLLERSVALCIGGVPAVVVCELFKAHVVSELCSRLTPWAMVQIAFICGENHPVIRDFKQYKELVSWNII